MTAWARVKQKELTKADDRQTEQETRRPYPQHGLNSSTKGKRTCLLKAEDREASQKGTFLTGETLGGRKTERIFVTGGQTHRKNH